MEACLQQQSAGLRDTRPIVIAVYGTGMTMPAEANHSEQQAS